MGAGLLVLRPSQPWEPVRQPDEEGQSKWDGQVWPGMCLLALEEAVDELVLLATQAQAPNLQAGRRGLDWFCGRPLPYLRYRIQETFANRQSCLPEFTWAPGGTWGFSLDHGK